MITRKVNDMNKIDRHSEICNNLYELYKSKNTDYGDSFGETFREFGMISTVVRMSDKWNRIKSLTKGAKNEVKDESLKDTLMDLANYCIMTVIEIDTENEKPKCMLPIRDLGTLTNDPLNIAQITDIT